MERRRQPPRYNAIVASAKVMTARPPAMRSSVRTEEWHNDVWTYYDTVGELRFGVGWIANGLSRVNLVGATRPDQAGDEPSTTKTPNPGDADSRLSAIEQATSELVGDIAGGPIEQAQMLGHLATLLSVPGVGWVLVEASRGGQRAKPDGSWKWRVLANDAVKGAPDGYEVADADQLTGWRRLDGPHILVKVWRAHPRNDQQPDSACRAALPVLRQIAMLDEHILATAQSRLAGAGLLILPSEMTFKPVAVAVNEDGESVVTDDDFVETLIETMTTPIADRASAAAVVPLVVQVPGEFVDKVKHITFWSEFSKVVVTMREAAVKRLALALDMPPEIVTGVSGMNHWGAWRVQEEAITLHISPLAEIICHALTVGFLRPALMSPTYGFEVEEAERMMVFFDVTDLTVRPDRSDDAGAAYDRIELSAAAYRREIGLSETDKPSDEEVFRRILLRTLDRSPTFAPDLLPALGIDIDFESESNALAPRTPTERDPERSIGGPPDGEDDEPIAASVFEACDALVYRALERAGNRLRIAAGRNLPGGQAKVNCPDATKAHVVLREAATAASLNDLLEGAWQRVPAVAGRLSLNPLALTAALDGYVRDLIVNGTEHEPVRLAGALGLTAGVGT